MATSVEQACQKAKDYRPEVQLQVKDGVRNQLSQKTKQRGKDRGAPSEPKCVLCFSGDQVTDQCQYLASAHNFVKTQLMESETSEDSAQSKKVYGTTDFAL